MESMRLEGICHIHEKIAVLVDRGGYTFALKKKKKIFVKKCNLRRKNEYFTC